MTISPTAQDLLKDAAKRGVLDDPTLLSRSKVRLLQGMSRMPKHWHGDPSLLKRPGAPHFAMSAGTSAPT